MGTASKRHWTVVCGPEKTWVYGALRVRDGKELTPLTGMSEQALPKFGPVLVHPGVRFEVHLLGRTQSLFELLGRGEQFVLLFRFPFLFQRECVPPGSLLRLLATFLTLLCRFPASVRKKLAVVSQRTLSAASLRLSARA
jgi:hypothetical protein